MRFLGGGHHRSNLQRRQVPNPVSIPSVLVTTPPLEVPLDFKSQFVDDEYLLEFTRGVLSMQVEVVFDSEQQRVARNQAKEHADLLLKPLEVSVIFLNLLDLLPIQVPLNHIEFVQLLQVLDLKLLSDVCRFDSLVFQFALQRKDHVHIFNVVYVLDVLRHEVRLAEAHVPPRLVKFINLFAQVRLVLFLIEWVLI